MNKKHLLLLPLVVVLLTVALLPRMSEAQIGFLIQETDGSPAYKNPRGLIFPNGSLSDSRGIITVASVFAGNLTLADSETIGNASDVISLTFDDAAAEVRLVGFEALGSSLTLQADQSDDNGDDWKITSVASGNQLTFANDTSGSQVTKLSLSTAGVLTLADSETLTNEFDQVTLASDDDSGNLIIQGFEGFDAILDLNADENDNSDDNWRLRSRASDNTFAILTNTIAKFTMTPAGAITLVGGLTGDGGDAIVGFLKSQVASTTTTLTIAQCGATIVNNSADVLTLPEASTALGCRYTFVVANASNLDINPNDGTDLILPFHLYESTAISPAAGDAIRSATLGASVTLEAVGDNAWAVVSVVDTWADIN